MKAIYFLLTIFLLGGTAAPQKQKPVPEYVKDIIKSESTVTDSIKKEFLMAANDRDRKTDLLIREKKKVDKENVLLKKENARLRQLVEAKPDTVFFTKASFLDRLFHRKKTKRAIANPNPETNLKNDAL